MRLTVQFEPADAIEVESRKAINAFLRWRGGRFAATFLDTAHSLAAVDTGAMKAGITAYAGEEPDSFARPEDASAYDPRPGTPAKLVTKAAALLLSKQAGLTRPYGFTSRAEYSSYVNDGTDKMPPRPFWTAAAIAADRLADEAVEEGIL